MSEDIWYELHLLAESFLLGIWFMILYDGFRLLRQVFRHPILLVGMEDIGYWVYAAIRLFSLLYYENDGNLRAYAIMGVFTGMILYNFTISLFLRKLLKKIQKYFMMKTEIRRKMGKKSKKGNKKALERKMEKETT